MPLVGMPFDEPLAERHNSSTATDAWSAYYAGRWSEELVPIGNLFAGQPNLCPEKLQRIAADPSLIDCAFDPIVILDVNGRRMVMDGHHRIIVAIARRRDTVRARVVWPSVESL